jgi:malonyl-CoA O-methyltransferase
LSEPERFEPIAARDGYDRWSRFYDDDPNPLVHVEQPLAHGLLGPLAGLSALDIGCGTGRHAIRMAREGAHVSAVDFSTGMLERARERAGDLKIDFRIHDLSEVLPFPDESFDRVMCSLVLDHIPDVAGLFAEMRRLVRPSGFAVVSVMHPAMTLRGVQARFREPDSGERFQLSSETHPISTYVMAVSRSGFDFDHFSEHSPDAAFAVRFPRAEKYVGWPLLLIMKLIPRP